MAEVDTYTYTTDSPVLMEYILIRDVNDTDADADALGALLQRRRVRINLIPYNKTSAGDAHSYESPSEERAAVFAARLSTFEGVCSGRARVRDAAARHPAKALSAPPSSGAAPPGLSVSVRWSSAQAREVDGACGQLALLPRKETSASACGGVGIGAAEPTVDIEDLVGGSGVAADVNGGAVGDTACRKMRGEDSLPLNREAMHNDEATHPAGALERALLADGLPANVWADYVLRVRGNRHSPSPAVSRLVLAVCSALGGQPLHALKADLAPEAPPPALQHAMLTSGHKLAASMKRRGMETWLNGAPREEMLCAYHEFVKHDVLPALSRLTGGRLVYQAEPTLRVSLPGSRTVGGPPRCGAECFHPAAELIVWVPLSAHCMGANAMHVEAVPGGRLLPIGSSGHPASAPGHLDGDGVHVGEYASFWGHRCRHGFIANDTEYSSVSLDFRIIPWHMYREDKVSATRSRHDLRLGNFYKVMDANVQGDVEEDGT